MLSRLSWKVCFLALSILIIAVSPAMAAMSLSGVKYMENVPLDTVVTFPMTLSLSPNDTATTYELTVLGFGNGVDGSYVGINPSEDTSIYSARKFITLDKSEVVLNPGESKVVTATIKTPRFGNGGLYALINIHPKVSNATGSTVVTAMNVPIMITLNGTHIVKSGSVDDVNVTVSENQADITTSFTNTGNHDYYGVSNVIIVKNNNGQEIFNSTSEPSVTTIIPNETVNYVQQVTNLNADKYTVFSSIYDSNNSVIDAKNVVFNIEQPATMITTEPIVETTTVFVTSAPTTTKSPLGSGIVVISIISAIAIIAARKK